MPATRLVLEIERIHPEEVLKPGQDKQPGNFLVAFGRDANGRPAKAFFTGSRAHKLQADMLAHLDGSEDLKGRRLTIDVTGEWKTDREPRKRGGEAVKDGAGKLIYDRHFETNSTASFLEGPLLELFRIRRAAKVRAYQADKLVQEGKKDEALALLRGFAEELGKLHRTTPSASKTEEMQSVVAAATEGTTNEPIGNEEAPDVASPSTSPLGGEAELEIVGDETSAGIQPTDAALAASRGETVQSSSKEEFPAQAVTFTEADPEAAAAARLAKTGRNFVDSPKTLPYPVTEEGLKAVAEIYKEEAAPVATQPETPPPPAEKPAAQPASPAPAARVAAPRLPPRVVRPPLPIRRP